MKWFVFPLDVNSKSVIEIGGNKEKVILLLLTCTSGLSLSVMYVQTTHKIARMMYHGLGWCICWDILRGHNLWYASKNDVHLLKPLLLLCHIAVTNKTLEDKNDNILENIIYMYRCNALHKKPSASSEEAFYLSHSCAANIERLESQHHLYWCIPCIPCRNETL